jgi:hypothetical protein
MGLPAQSFQNSTSEGFSSIFEPDVVLPSQFYNAKQAGLRGGERRLMAALLSDGIEAYILHCSAKRGGERIDAVEWVETRDQDYVFSFDNVCDCLGIDAEYLRLGLMRYVEAVRGQVNSGEGNKVWKKIRRPRKR